jgi:hypothetical protein
MILDKSPTAGKIKVVLTGPKDSPIGAQDACGSVPSTRKEFMK